MTRIEWTEKTWNPVTGCTKVSPGCDHCYAESIARRFAGSKSFPNGFDVTLHPERLDAPLRWRKPSRVFVNSMSDLFHHAVPQHFIAQVFATMARSPQHTYQVLTKRHGRMRSLLRTGAFVEQVRRYAESAEPEFDDPPGWWPLPNVWLGVSAEDQKRADLRIPALLNTPAAVRFVSAEPLLGSLNIDSLWGGGVWGPGLDWVIVGGESGPGARPMSLAWAKSLVNDCRALGIAPFVKQLGSAWARDWSVGGEPVSRRDPKGGDMATWPAELQVREYPTAATS